MIKTDEDQDADEKARADQDKQAVQSDEDVPSERDQNGDVSNTQALKLQKTMSDIKPMS